MKKEWFADDRIVIPENIKRMTNKELETEIGKLEKEIRKNKKKTQKSVTVV